MKKLLLILFSVTLIFSSFPFTTRASEDRTVFYLDFGDVKIGDSAVSGYDEKGNLVSNINPVGYVVTQSSPSKAADHSISVTDGIQNVEIKNINIKRTGENDYALCVLKTASINLTVSGENHLVPGTYRAGFDIAVKASATVDGDGILYAQSEIEAGIGGGSGKSNGTLTINSGTIYATGGIGGYGSGIGGGSAGNGGTITINGGNIVAKGGVYGSGIGGGNLCRGGIITINGGTVTAIGGESAAGIGGGFAGNGGTVTINGGSVKAVAGKNAENIGNGYRCNAAFGGIHNSDGNALSLLTVALSDFKSVYQNGITSSPITAGHTDDTNLYFYTDSDKSVLTAYMSDESVRFFDYNSDGCTEKYPYLDTDDRVSDCLVTADSDKLAVADGYKIEKKDDGFYLVQNDIYIDSFLPVTRGDMNHDGVLDGTDAVIAACVDGRMLSDRLSVKLADANGDGKVNNEDIEKLNRMGISSGSVF